MAVEEAGTLTRELKELVAEIIEIDAEEVTMEADFVEDLGMDSMQALEIMAAIEKKYSIQVPEEHLEKAMNLSSLVKLAEELLG